MPGQIAFRVGISLFRGEPEQTATAASSEAYPFHDGDDAEAIHSRRMSCIGRQAILLCRFRIVCAALRLAVIIKFELGVDLPRSAAR
jgi:hypothetical protein